MSEQSKELDEAEAIIDAFLGPEPTIDEIVSEMVSDADALRAKRAKELRDNVIIARDEALIEICHELSKGSGVNSKIGYTLRQAIAAARLEGVYP